MPVPVSVTLSAGIVADRQHVAAHPAHVVGGDGEGLQGERAAARRVLREHRVAGVDREVDDHLLELAGIGAHRAEAAAVLDLELDPLAEQPVEQMRDLGDDVGELEHLRAQRLLARESEQLPGQVGGAVRVGADLLDVVIVAVAGRVAHQHQVAGAEDRGQDIVEIVGDAAGELADRLHLGRLGDLALEPRLLAIVLDREQHGGVAEAARAGDGHRHRLLRIGLEPHREVARHAAGRGRSGGPRRRPPPCPRRRRGRRARPGARWRSRPTALRNDLVEEEEAAVAVGQREAERQAVEQGVDVRGHRRRRAGPARRRAAGRRRARPAPSPAGHLDDPQRAARPCLRRRTGTGRSARRRDASTSSLPSTGGASPSGPAARSAKAAIGGEDPARGVDDRRSSAPPRPSGGRPRRSPAASPRRRDRRSPPRASRQSR